MRYLLLFTLILCSNTALAKERLAILNLEGDTSEKNRLYFTDSLRRLAQKHTEFLVYTNENIQDFVPQETLSDCVGECEVEVGRKLHVHYIISGRIVKLTQYHLVLKIHSTRTSEMQNSVEILADSPDAITEELENSFLRLMQVRKKSFEDVKTTYLKMLQAKEDEDRKFREIQKSKEREYQRAWEENRLKQRAKYNKIRKKIQAEEAKLREESVWVVDSPFDLKVLTYNPSPKPTLWLGRSKLDVLQDGQSFVYSSQDSFYEDCNKFYNPITNSSTCTFDLFVDQITTSYDGVAYDKNGNALTPQILPIKSSKYTLAYLEPTLWKSDLDKHKARAYDTLTGVLMYSVVSLPLAAATVGLSFDYKLYNRKHGGRNSVALFKTNPRGYGTLLGSFLVSTLFATWLVVDHNDYHYPKYIDKIESPEYLDHHKQWLKRLKYIDQTQKNNKYIQYLKSKKWKVKHQLAIGKDWDRSKCVKDAQTNENLNIENIRKPRIYQKTTAQHTKKASSKQHNTHEIPTFDLCIDDRGKVRAIRLVKSVGYEIDAKAMNALQDWWFFPAEYTKRKTIPFILKNVKAL